MDAPLMRAVAGVMADSGLHVLRFNFRGVGRSEGSWGGGVSELDDVDAAVATARETHPTLPLGLAGWSFGAMMGLSWQARSGDDSRYAGIAPPLRLSEGPEIVPPERLAASDRLFILGDRDQFTSVEELSGYVRATGGRLEVLKGSDHFFYFREDRVGKLVAQHLGGRVEG